ncbi:TIGR02679 domain-containing protein [Arthrobacter sp. NPDC057013]|uniref:TIGR02679 domain-containing protein n=1 Tax=Arthrobacter sp. NPDC057013 TaxID=3345999 RepID=UPI00362BD94F
MTVSPNQNRAVPEAVLRWARRPGSATLLAEVREKVEAGKTGDRVQVAVVEDQRDDVGRMLGVAWELSRKPVTLRLLRDALTKAGADLTGLLTEVGGPLRDKPTERRLVAHAKEQMRSDVVDLLAGAGVLRPIAELAVVRRWLGADPQAVAGVVAAAWSALPTQPGGSHSQLDTVGLAEFAGQKLLDPHALDRDHPAGRAVARLLAATFAWLDQSEAPGGGVEAVMKKVLEDALAAAAVDAAGSVLQARSWRGTWTRAGISCDQVSSTVLVLNLPLNGVNPALAEVTAVAGEPIWLTARMTVEPCHTAMNWTSNTGLPRCQSNGTEPDQLVVRVCENPSVIEAAANRLGASCPPLVCLYGRPSSAAWSVLSAVAAEGAQILLSTDRDVAGDQIATEVEARIGRRYGPLVSPWLPSEDGIFEEERLTALLTDLTNHASAHS